MNLNEFYNNALRIIKKLEKDLDNSITTLVIENFIETNDIIEVCLLNDTITNMLKCKSTMLLLSLSNLIKNIVKHPEVGLEIYECLNELINSSDEIFIDKGNLKIFKRYHGKLYEIVIKTTRNKTENYLLSVHCSHCRRIKNKKR